MNHIASIATAETDIEREIQAKGKTAPRVTPEDLQANIASEHYFTAANGVLGVLADDTVLSDPDAYLDIIRKTSDAPEVLDLLTFCVLVLKNGFTVTGESACASPENFDPAIGRKRARQNAEAKIWPLMGYQLKEQLYEASLKWTRELHLEAAANHISAANARQTGS